MKTQATIKDCPYNKQYSYEDSGNHKGLPLQQYSYEDGGKSSDVGAIPCGCPE